MFSPGDKVVVALSGGSDSVGLLHLLLDLKGFDLKVIAAHYNHKIRGDESERDARFCRHLSEDLKVEFEYSEAGEDDYRKDKRNLSLEDAARKLRYGFLKNVLEKYKAHRIATAHTMNDQAETFIMRAIRGSGSRGLGGIPPVNGNIIRPLIKVQKREIEDYLRSNRVDWQEDSSNRSVRFTRNRIRLELFPILKEINPGIDKVLSGSSEVLRIESGFIDNHVDKVYGTVMEKEPFGYLGKVKEYLLHHKAIRLGILRKTVELLKGDLKQISQVHLLAVDDMIEREKPSGETVLPDGIDFSKGYEVFCISRGSGLAETYSYTINGPGSYRFDNGLEVSVDTTSDRSGWEDEMKGIFSIDSTRFPLVVRNYELGDKFRPLGMRKFKKIKDLFIDEKVPRFFRRSVPVFETRDGVIWVGGIRIDDRFKAKRTESEFLRIQIQKPELSIIEQIRRSERQKG